MSRTQLLMLPGMLCDERLFDHQTENLSDIVAMSFGDITQDDSISGAANSVLERAPERFALAGLSLGGIVAFGSSTSGAGTGGASGAARHQPLSSKRAAARELEEVREHDGKRPLRAGDRGSTCCRLTFIVKTRCWRETLQGWPRTSVNKFF